MQDYKKKLCVKLKDLNTLVETDDVLISGKAKKRAFGALKQFPKLIPTITTDGNGNVRVELLSEHKSIKILFENNRLNDYLYYRTGIEVMSFLRKDNANFDKLTNKLLGAFTC